MKLDVAAADLPPLQEHPIYRDVITQSGSGRWQQALSSLQILQGIYPNNAELNKLVGEVRMRATMAQFQGRRPARTTRRWSPRGLLIGGVVLVSLAAVAIVVYQFWLQPLILQEVRVRQVTSLRDQAEEALAAGNYTQARESLEQLLVILPEDPETKEMLRQVAQLEQVTTLYSQAKTFMEARQWDQALAALTELERLDPTYRDLPDLLQVARESQVLEQQFQAAETTFNQGDWPAAIAQYQAIQQASLAFRYEDIEARLFESQLYYARTLIDTAGTDPEKVKTALAVFGEALKIKPLDDQALGERRLAETYLAALDSTDPAEVIELLQTVYKQQPEYAGKAAAELLYSALLARAETALGTGNKNEALNDYRLAADLHVADRSVARQKLDELMSN